VGLFYNAPEPTRGASFRRGSRILQGRVSNPSERGTSFRPPNCFNQCYRNQTIRTTSRAMSNPLLSSYSSCFVFTKHPVQLKTVTTCFQSIFFSKKAPKQKGGCLDTLDTPSPGSATDVPRHVYFELVSRHSQSSQIQFEACS